MLGLGELSIFRVQISFLKKRRLLNQIEHRIRDIIDHERSAGKYLKTHSKISGIAILNNNSLIEKNERGI